MKLYPYSKIKTENLASLLLAARVVGILGYVFSLLTIILWVATIFLGPRTLAGDPNGPIISMTVNSFRAPALFMSLGTLSSALFCFVIGGLCAAVVSIERKYTQSQNET